MHFRFVFQTQFQYSKFSDKGTRNKAGRTTINCSKVHKSFTREAVQAEIGTSSPIKSWTVQAADGWTIRAKATVWWELPTWASYQETKGDLIVPSEFGILNIPCWNIQLNGHKFRSDNFFFHSPCFLTTDNSDRPDLFPIRCIRNDKPFQTTYVFERRHHSKHCFNCILVLCTKINFYNSNDVSQFTHLGMILKIRHFRGLFWYLSFQFIRFENCKD